MRTMSGHPVPGLQPRRHTPRPPGRTARLSGLLLCLLLLGGAGTLHAQAADPNRAIAVAKKLELLQRYLGSASAEKLANHDNTAVQELYARARERGEQALASYNKGDMGLAEERLNEAFRAYTEALDSSRAKRDAAEIQKQNASLRDEIRSYLQAFDEALLAKGPAAAALLNRGQVNELLAEAERLEAAGDAASAQNRLKEAYNMAVSALTRVRENETVVYTLDFRTPADEYRYEQNRYQSYAMLVAQMRESSELGEQALKLAQRYQDEGASLLKQAEAEAAGGQYQQAIQTMEEANKRLVRSLQMLGLSIPG